MITIAPPLTAGLFLGIGQRLTSACERFDAKLVGPNTLEDGEPIEV